MDPELLSVLCDPIGHDGLEVIRGPDRQEALVNPKTGRQFPVRDGIPVFFEDPQVVGLNRRYQAMYDRFAPLYGLLGWFFNRWKGTGWVHQYLDELEIKAGDRVLEVSVGTGRNLLFLPGSARFFGLDISWGMLDRKSVV